MDLEGDIEWDREILGVRDIERGGRKKRSDRRTKIKRERGQRFWGT